MKGVPKRALYYLIDFILTILTIVLIVAFSKIKEGGGLTSFFDTTISILHSFLFIDQLTVQLNNSHYFTYLEAGRAPFFYSIILLSGALIVTLFSSLALTLVSFLSGKKLRSTLKSIAFTVGCVPDVILVFSLQLGAIWIFKKTDILIVDPIAGLDNVYILPILTLAILPTMMLYQSMALSVEEEEMKAYVEFAVAKGIRKSRILIRHIIRNTIISTFANLQLLFWFMVSNLLILEYLFNARGFLKFLYSMFDQPEMVAISLALLFVPFYLLDLLGKAVVWRLTGESI